MLTLSKTFGHLANRALENKRLTNYREDLAGIETRAEIIATETRDLLIRVVNSWPWTDREAIRKSDAEFKAGLGIDVRDIIASLQD